MPRNTQSWSVTEEGNKTRSEIKYALSFGEWNEPFIHGLYKPNFQNIRDIS